MTNSLIQNHYASVVPEVGMGVTELCWSDRHAYTVVWMAGNKRIGVQRDRAIRIDTNGMSDAQRYRYERDEKAPVVVLSLRKDGHWRRVGESASSNVFMVGQREEYHDYSF